MNRRTILLLSLQSVLALALLIFFSARTFPFTTDSFLYISTAQEVSRGHGIMFTNFFVQPVEPNFLPAILEPPGYPFLIVALKWIGINEYTGGVLLPRIYFILFPWLFFLIFNRWMSVSSSLITAFVCTFMFSCLKCSLMAWTDVPYLFFSLLGILGAYYIVLSKAKSNLFFVFLAGFVAGYAFFIRYMGITLLASVLVAFILALAIKAITIKNFLRLSAAYVLGAGFIVGPYLIYNMSAFGSIQPFHMSPSFVSLSENIRDYFRGLAEMVFATPTFALVIAAILILLSVVLLTRAKKFIQDDKEKFLCLAILIFYFVFYSVFLIGMKTKYFISEEIGERYLLQVAWIAMASVVSLVFMGVKRLEKIEKMDKKSVAVLLLICFMIIQCFPVANFYYDNKNMKILAKKIQENVEQLEKIPEDYVIVSNIADITHYFSGRNIRILSNYMPAELINIFHEKKKFAVFLIKDHLAVTPTQHYAPIWNYAPGYKLAYFNEDIDILLPSGQR